VTQQGEASEHSPDSPHEPPAAHGSPPQPSPQPPSQSPPPENDAEPVRTHRWGFGAFLFVEAVFVLSAVFLSVLIDGRRHPIALTLVGTIVPAVLAAGVAMLITTLRGDGPVKDLRIGFTREDFRVGMKFGVIGLICTTVAAVIWTRIVGEENATSALGSLVTDERLPVFAVVVMFLYVWLIGPVCEEIIYRGLLWGALERLRWGRWTVLLLSTAVFAVSHLEPWRTSLLLVIGLPIGLARMYTGRLGSSVIAHQANNFLPALTYLLTALGVMAA
jgi:membrane protease YdiL (CAAX protease family)